MTDLSVSEARKRLPELVKRAAAGESFTVTLNGFPMASITATISSKQPASEVPDASQQPNDAGDAVAEAQPVEEDFFKRRDRERVEAARRKLEAKK